MTIPELIGFLITILVLISAMVRKFRENKFRRENPEEYEEQQRAEEEAFKAFLRGLDIDIDVGEETSRPKRRARSAPPPPPSVPPPPAPSQGSYVPRSTVAEGFDFKSQIEDRQLKAKVEQRQLRSNISDRGADELVSDRLRTDGKARYGKRRSTESRAHAFLGELPTTQALLLAHEIFGPPKSLEQ